MKKILFLLHQKVLPQQTAAALTRPLKPKVKPSTYGVVLVEVDVCWLPDQVSTSCAACTRLGSASVGTGQHRRALVASCPAIGEADASLCLGCDLSGLRLHGSHLRQGP